MNLDDTPNLPAPPPELILAVDRLAKLPDEFRSLRPPVESLAAIRTAANRLQAAIARERGTDQPVLTVAFAGCTGAGKSTLINALARSRITRVIGRAATTRQAHVYHHRDIRLAGLPSQLAQSAVMVPHERPELFAKVLIDTPDLDTAVVTNRQTTKSILKAATLVLYVFTPEKYAEERVWSVIEQERRFSAFAAILNKADRLSPDELARVTDDLRGIFASNGAGDVRIFRTVATNHEPKEGTSRDCEEAGARQGREHPDALQGKDAAGVFPLPDGRGSLETSDDFNALRTFIERELRRADIMRLARRQRRAAVASVRAAVDAVAGPAALANLDRAADSGEAGLEAASSKLAAHWRPVFLAADDAVLPAAKRRYHERFRGPIRAWFAMWDGAALASAKLAGKPADTLDLSTLRASLEAGRQVVDDRLQTLAQRVQDALHEGKLPVGRWTAVVAGRSPSQQVIGDVANEVESACRVQAATCSVAREKLARVVSWISVVVVAMVVAFGAWRFAADLYAGRYEGPLLLVNILGLLLLSMLALHLFVGIAGPGGQSCAEAEAAGRKAIDESLARVLNGWLASYRAELEADVADIRGPLDAIEKVFAKEDAEVGETDDGGAGLGKIEALPEPEREVAVLQTPSEVRVEPVALPAPVETIEIAPAVPRGMVAVEAVAVHPVNASVVANRDVADGNSNAIATTTGSAQSSDDVVDSTNTPPAEPVSNSEQATGPKKSLSDYLRELK